MRFLRIFFLYFQFAFTYRGRAFIWFLIAFLNPLIVLSFWKATYSNSDPTGGMWTFSALSSYYILLIIANACLMAHIEDDVAVYDIQRGSLLKYLVRPFPYFLFKFLEELPWRIIQGGFGVIILFVFIFFTQTAFTNISWQTLITTIIIAGLAYCISFLFKLILGISAFWLTDYRGLQQLSEVVTIVFAGTIMPLNLFPYLLRMVSFLLPFSYMTYFPIIAIQGKIMGPDLLKVVSMQIFWLLILIVVYQKLWQKGLRKFTGVSN